MLAEQSFETQNGEGENGILRLAQKSVVPLPRFLDRVHRAPQE